MAADEKTADGWLKTLASILKELGLPSFIFIVGFVVFLCYGTADQKKEFIDRFILFKNVQGDPLPYFIVLVAVLVLFAGTTYYQHLKLKILKDEVERLGKEKTQLQEALLEKTLRSSQT